MKLKKFFPIAVVFIFIGVFFIWQGIYLPKDSKAIEDKIFSIEKGQSFFQIAKNLEAEGLIKNKFFFDVYMLLKGAQTKLQAGKYRLNSSMDIPKIAKKIISGDTAKITITIPEGFTVKQIEERLNLKLPGENLEGFLFPDTYQFTVDVTGQEVVKIMKDNFYKKTAGLKITPEIIIMASLLEKEVKTKEEKELVSGVLWKRLKMAIPLQVDAEMWTYKNLGLPPQAIANPGLESILAAIYPKESPYWYYLSTPAGQTIFSKTLEEHNIAKAKYLK